VRTYRIPAPLENEVGVLLGVPLGDAVVATVLVALGALAVVRGGHRDWPWAVGSAVLGAILLLRWHQEPLWRWLVRAVAFLAEPRRYVADQSLEVSHHAYAHEAALSHPGHRRWPVSNGT
jgi:hypothetical protein